MLALVPNEEAEYIIVWDGGEEKEAAGRPLRRGRLSAGAITVIGAPETMGGGPRIDEGTNGPLETTCGSNGPL